MVFFTCNACGTCVKKPAVEKHIYQCRNFGSLSCMDCNKDFHGDSYKAHTKCVSELEKYSGEGWKAPAGFNKGERKQNEWMNTVTATIEHVSKSAPPAIRSLLHALTTHDNVPRKRPKFLNFVTNISRNRFDVGTIESVWTLLEEQWKREKEAKTLAKPQEPEPVVEATEEVKIEIEENGNPVKKSKKHKKKKHQNGAEPSEPEPVVEATEEVKIEIEENGNPVKKSKKHKKKKHQNGAEPSEPEPVVEATEEVKIEIEENGNRVKKSKKHKKRHHGNSTEEIAADAEVVEEQPKKKKKKKKAKESTESE